MTPSVCLGAGNRRLEHVERTVAFFRGAGYPAALACVGSRSLRSGRQRDNKK